MRPFDDTDGVSFVSRDDLPLVLPSLCFARSETDHVGEVSGSPRKRPLLGNCCESVISSSPKSRALPDIVRLSAAKGELDGLAYFCAAAAASFAEFPAFVSLNRATKLSLNVRYPMNDQREQQKLFSSAYLLERQ